MFVFTKREPLGVVAAVVPWNSQLFLVAVKIGPALAAGNTVVLKASEHASAAMLEFGKLIEKSGYSAWGRQYCYWSWRALWARFDWTSISCPCFFYRWPKCGAACFGKRET